MRYFVCVLILFAQAYCSAESILSCKNIFEKVILLYPEASIPLIKSNIDSTLASEALVLINRTYSELGGSKYTSASAISIDLTHCYIYRDAEGKLTAFVGVRTTPYGLKTTVMATDDTAVTKLRAGFFFQHLIQTENAFSELSSSSLMNAKRLYGSLPVISFERARIILSPYEILKPSAQEIASAIKNKVIPNEEKYINSAYVRTINVDGVVKFYIKVLVGNPK